MEKLDINLEKIRILDYNTAIIGSGAAGLNCALHLVEEGIPPDQIAIITENLGGGTSFNAGSDKQTYYKLAIVGDQSDSPLEMAKDLFSGGAMHGDIALIEATNSIREFFHLIQLGVPFPHDSFGGYVGYKTDNDPRQRATSIGPYTSKEIAKRLLDVVVELDLNIFDKVYAAKILINNEEIPRAIGILGIDMDLLSHKKDWNDLVNSIRIFKTQNVIMATGASALLYKHSVYPESQIGSTGLAIGVGCILQNLTESQFGIASKSFRWNLSGSYQQVIPRYYSIDKENRNYEFLNEYFPTFKELSKAIFLKGYQWPFSSERVENNGSSLIDLAIYYETQILGRKVYLDYVNNPSGFDIKEIDITAKDYLNASNALEEIPYLRLLALNERAYMLFKENNIDLSKEPLEISVCNQHLNGGIAGDTWWESNIKHLFAIGEINGSHGIHRPGGAALNAGQVGGLRAAQRIGKVYNNPLGIDNSDYLFIIEDQLYQFLNEIAPLISLDKRQSSPSFILSHILEQIQNRMEKYAGIIRPDNNLDSEIEKLVIQLKDINKSIHLESNIEIISYLRIKDCLLTQLMFLSAIKDYHAHFGSSRGSYIIPRNNHSNKFNRTIVVLPKKLNQFNFVKNNLKFVDKIQTMYYNHGKIEVEWEQVRQIPKSFGWFETVWKDFSNGKIFEG